MIRDAARVSLGLLCCLALALAVIGCVQIGQPPSTIVQPEVVGTWVSEDVGPPTVLHLDTGQAIPLGPDRPRLAFGNTSERTPATLLMAGHGPDGRAWWAILNPDPSVTLPGGQGPCYGFAGNAYDEGDTVVIRAAATADTNQSAVFGIRLPKARTMATAPASYAPWYGMRSGFCLNKAGQVASLHY